MKMQQLLHFVQLKTFCEDRQVLFFSGSCSEFSISALFFQLYILLLIGQI